MLGKTDMVRFLLAHGADPRRKDSDGQTALHLAKMLGKSQEVIEILEATLQAN